MEQEHTIVRAASKEDIQQIYDLIKELADFEKMGDQVKISPETLIADGFSENPAFGCYVAISKDDNSTVVGYALYYYCYSTWLGKSVFLEDLYVKPDYRRHGIGKQLFLKVAEIAHKSSKRLDFHVLNWNPATTFYKKLDSLNLTEVDDWQLFRLDGKALQKLFVNTTSTSE